MLNYLKSTLLLFLCPIFAWGLASVKEMSLEEKAGQILLVHFHGETANEDAKTLVQKIHVGGFIYYNWANGLNSPQQVQTLSQGLQELAQKSRLSIPLLIAIDQEGGLVARLTQGFTIFPGNKALGMAGNPGLAENAAYAMSQEMQAAGGNLSLSLIGDININQRNPVIGIRAFSDKPDEVVTFARSALQGYQRAKMRSCLKHYPGHGDVEVDSHADLPFVRKSKEELDKVELLPFAQLAPQVDAIMTAHIVVPALDPDHCSTLSKKSLDYLRNELGFQGVIIADSVVMEGVLKESGSVDEAVIQALNAGCDFISLGGKQLLAGQTGLELTVTDVQRIHGKIVDAVKSGRVSEERLNQAVQRVLVLKDRYPIVNPKPTDIQNTVRIASHEALAREIASLALRTVKNNPAAVASLEQKKVLLIAPQILKASIDSTTLLRMGKENDALFFNGLTPSAQDVELAKEKTKAADVVLVCSYNAWKNPGQEMLIQSLIETGKPVVLMVARDPLDETLFPKAAVILTTFSPTAPSIQAACEQLQGIAAR